MARFLMSALFAMGLFGVLSLAQPAPSVNAGGGCANVEEFAERVGASNYHIAKVPGEPCTFTGWSYWAYFGYPESLRMDSYYIWTIQEVWRGDQAIYGRPTRAQVVVQLGNDRISTNVELFTARLAGTTAFGSRDPLRRFAPGNVLEKEACLVYRNEMEGGKAAKPDYAVAYRLLSGVFMANCWLE